MKRSAFAVLSLSLLALGCPGQKPPGAPTAAPVADTPKGPLVWHVSKSGLGFRLSNADEAADQPISRSVAPSTPLGDADTKRILGRMPELKSDPDDSKDFALRDKSIPAPRPGKTVTEAFPPPAGPPPTNVPPPGPLTIERHEPEGPVDLAPHLTMTFSQPMVPITSMDDLGKEKPPVSLVPEPPGKWRWLGTRTLMFQPDKRFPMATEYAVDIPAGTRSMAGQALAKSTHWTFTTPPLTMKRHYPSSSSEPLEPILFAEFDQAIDAEQMLKSIELSSGAGAIPIELAPVDEIETNDSVRRATQQAEKGRFIAFRAKSKLPVATGFTVRIKAGAPSAEGPLRTKTDQAFAFSTYGAMKVNYSRCGYSDQKCAPLDSWAIAFTNPIDLKHFKKEMITVTPDLPGMKVVVNGNSIGITGHSKGRTHYDVTIAGAIGDVHDQTMGSDAKVSFDVGSAKPTMFGAEQEMIVLDPSSPRSYSVYSINEPGLHARVFSLTPADWEKYVAFSQEWERPRKIAPPGHLVSDKVIVPKKAPDELVTTPIDLSAALSGGVGQALVVVEPTGPVQKGYQRPELHIWVQATELGVDAMIENDQVTGWVTKLADGTPLEGVDVQLLTAGSAKTDKDGLARVPLDPKTAGRLVVARSGKDVAIVPELYFNVSNYLKQYRGVQTRAFVYDDRGMYKPGEEVRMKGFLRNANLERGGDIDAIPNIGGQTSDWVVRDPRGAEIAKGKVTFDDHGTFDLAFKLPGNANLGTASVEFSAYGSFYHGFQIQEFRRPEFEVTAKSSEGPHFVGEHAIATLTASYYAGGGLPDAPVTWNVRRSIGQFTPPNRGDYHFGADVSSYWSWRSTPNPKEGPKDETWTSHTNAQGVHRLRVDFDALEPSYPMSLDFTGQVEDVNRQQWAGRTTMLVHPADDYVGMRLTKNFVREGENIDSDSIVSDIEGKLVSDRPIVVKAARLDWEQEGSEFVEKEVDVTTCEVVSPAGDAPVRCSLKTTQGGSWKVWAIVTDAHGRKSQTLTRTYVMGSGAPKDRSLDRGKANVVPDKADYKPGDLAEVLVISPFVPAEGLLTVRRQGIVHVERFSMKSASAAIKLKLDETLVPNVEVAVSLVGSDVRDDPTGTPDPKLPKRPAFAVGSVGLKIVPTTRTLAVKAVARKPTLDPGGTTDIDIDVKDPSGRPAAGADVALVVADEAVLALSGYKTPDPIDVFYAARSADVHDLVIRDRVLLADPTLARRAEEPRGDTRHRTLMLGGMAPGAGGKGFGHASPAPLDMSDAPAPSVVLEASLMNKQEAAKEKSPAQPNKPEVPAKDVTGADNTTPMQVRADFSALALFAPRVKTDAQGHATVPLKLPDNLTRYRVMAVAASGPRQFGSNESTITARLPIMVRPSAPRFLNFGDRFELPIVVQNQTDAPVEVGVVLRATNATIDGNAAKRVKIAANDRVEVRFDAGTVKPGTARFQIGIASGGFSDASEIEMPVWTPATTEAFATYGEIDEGAMAQPVKMPPGVFPQFGGLEITTSSTQLQALTDALLYLVKYPYECNEQIASRVIAIAALRDVLTAFKADGLPSAKVLDASMKGDFEKLTRHQNYDGGWGFWQETPWPYLSVHVTHALVRAKEKGYKPDENTLARAKQYLRAIETKYPYWYSAEMRRAITSYALYVRNRMGDPDAARARRLIAEAGGVDKMPIEAVGWLWPTISEDKNSGAELEAIRRHVSNRVTETAGNAHFVSGYADGDWVLLNSDRRADAVLLEAMIGDQKDSTLIPKVVKGLLAHRTAGHWYNTQENAFVLLALDRYFNTFEKVTPDFVARVWLGDRFAGQHQFKGRTTEYSETKVPMNWLGTEMKGTTQNLVIGKDGPGRLYYRVGMQYAPTDLKLPPADHGFVVSRTYEGADKPDDVKRDADGTWRVKAGTKVRVRVSMVAQSRRYHVALVDPLPAGLEALNPALAVTGEIPKDPKANDASAKNNRYWYWSRTWYEHQNMRDERVEAFTSLLWDGVWDYTYVAKATTPGIFVVPPPKAEEMYAPETFGRGAGDRMVVE